MKRKKKRPSRIPRRRTAAAIQRQKSRRYMRAAFVQLQRLLESDPPEENDLN